MLNARKFALAGGILWGASMFVITLISVYNGYASDFLSLMANVYPGYSVSVSGSIVGFIYGFIDAGIGGWLFATLYNRISSK